MPEKWRRLESLRSSGLKLPALWANTLCKGHTQANCLVAQGSFPLLKREYQIMYLLNKGGEPSVIPACAGMTHSSAFEVSASY